MASTPVASGSSVPAWPAFWASKIRLTAPTAWVEVTPSGLSSTTQPWTGLPFFLRGIVVLHQVAAHLLGLQQVFDLLGLGEGVVLHEAQVGGEFEGDAA